MKRVTSLFRYYFNLDSDKESEQAVITSIIRNISFRGSNLWTLVFAVIIASVGLNVNSTAVIIGAMLISPLMGPIMGVGLGIGISEFELVRRGLKNLLIAVVFSIATSTLYFFVTPLHTVTSELQARTTPTIWDVFIAFAGGLAGIVGATRKERGNVIPGVAIATALMPPLCTAGFGIATGRWYYFLGALYLFFINSVFICIATVLILRFMHFHRHVIDDEVTKKRVNRYLLIIVIITVMPSIWLAYRIVQKAVFENAAEHFVRREMRFANTQVVSKSFVLDGDRPRIETLLIGEILDSTVLDTLQSHLKNYNLGNAELVVRQGMDARKEIDFSQIKASILDEVLRNEDTMSTEALYAAEPKSSLPDLRAELKALFPQIDAYSLSRTNLVHTDSIARADSVLLFVVDSHTTIRNPDKQRMEAWLKTRLSADSILTIYRLVRQ